MTPDQLFKDFEAGFRARKFTAGLLLAFIDFFTALGVPGLKAKNFNDVLYRFPRQTMTSAGKRANTLIVALPGDKGTLSLRPYYNAAERFFRAEHKRFDYPSCAPHATQAWPDYQEWLDALSTFTPAQLKHLRGRVAQFVLDTLTNQAFDPASVQREPRLFEAILENFDMTAKKGEPTGAAFQGIAFGFLRADNPHLQIEISKVRTGSKRLQRIGDIDGWEGARLAISAEVKQFELKPEDVPDLEGFANEIGRRGALGVVIALGFREGVREKIEALGVKALDQDDLLRIVQLWDPLKQRTAQATLVYYAKHVEMNSSLAERLDAFLLKATQSLGDKPTD
jgi:hypothetical protein